MYDKIGTIDTFYLQWLGLQFLRETVKRAQTSPEQMFASRAESAANKEWKHFKPQREQQLYIWM